MMVRSMIFDWYGTLAQWEDAGVSNYVVVLSELGYEPDLGAIGAYHARWDGIDHREHSTSRDTYAKWTRTRLNELVRD